MSDFRCLVLGASGFVGQRLCDRLARDGHSVRAFARRRSDRSLGPYRGDVEWVTGDFLDANAVRSALVGCDIVFHLVSSTTPRISNQHPDRDLQENVIATVHLLDAMRDLGVPKIVFVSSGGAIYGEPSRIPIAETDPTEPVSAYGIGKLAIEKYLALYQRLANIRHVSLRVANIFGVGQPLDRSQGAIGIFIDKATRGEPIEIWGTGETVRDYVYLDDVVDALVAASRFDGAESVFNIGSGEGRSLNDVLDVLEKELGFVVQRRHLPARSADVAVSILDIRRANTVLGWTPATSFHTGIRRIVADLRRRNALPPDRARSA